MTESSKDALKEEARTELEQELKMSEPPNTEVVSDANGRSPHTTWARHRENPSLFGPVVLIGMGVYFLLRNLGYWTEMSFNWQAALQLWPLWLILAGVNMIVRQVPRPFGSFLSALVGATAVVIFGYVLLFSDGNALFSSQSIEAHTQQIEYTPTDNVTTAVVNIDFAVPGADLYALEDSRSAIAGEITYLDDIVFEPRESGDTARIDLHTKNDFAFFLNPINWPSVEQMDRWQIGLTPNMPLNIDLDGGAGSLDLDFAALQLEELDIDGGAGSVDLWLPGGDYTVNYDIGAGSSEIWLGDGGQQTVDINGGAGSITLYLPETMEARISIDSGAGSFSVSDFD